MIRRMFSGTKRRFVALSALAAVLGACSSLGPASIARDRFDYVASMSDSWKRQALVNLVKVRYADAPVFLDVDSVISSYTWETEVNLGATGAATPADSSVTLGGSGRYSDQPTITYSPLTGAKFARSLLTPLSIPTILALLQSGYRADLVLRTCVSSMNGLENAYGGLGSMRGGSPQFAEILNDLRLAQEQGRLDIRTEESKEESSKGKTVLLMELRPNGSAAAAESDARFRALLGLDPLATDFEVSNGLFGHSPREIALLTRSMMQVLTDVASYIEVPQLDVTDGRVYVPQRTSEQLRAYPPLLHVHTGDKDPDNSFAAVRYRKHWFWIDDRDVYSKAAFNFLLLMFSLTERGDTESRPIITVPAR
jgi:hypothetical protein